MRTIIAGSRGITGYWTLLLAVAAAEREWGYKITEVVTGKARGVDTLGEHYAKENNLPLHEYPADWNKHGKRAGYLRNVEMGEVAQALLAIWDGQSPGTKHMIDIARKKGLHVYVYEV